MTQPTLIDALRDAIPLSEASALFPGRPHVSTLFRWAGRGVRGCRLQTWHVGRDTVTTVAAVEQFLRDLNTDAAKDSDASAAARRGREAGRALEALGL